MDNGFQWNILFWDWNLTTNFWLLGKGTETGGPKGWKFHHRMALEILAPWDDKDFWSQKSWGLKGSGIGSNTKKTKFAWQTSYVGKGLRLKVVEIWLQIWLLFGKTASELKIEPGQFWEEANTKSKFCLAKKFVEAENWKNSYVRNLTRKMKTDTVT